VDFADVTLAQAVAFVVVEAGLDAGNVLGTRRSMLRITPLGSGLA
jgi:hypothetical protein